MPSSLRSRRYSSENTTQQLSVWPQEARERVLDELAPTKLVPSKGNFQRTYEIQMSDSPNKKTFVKRKNSFNTLINSDADSASDSHVRTLQDYSHLEPPLALPSSELLPTYPIMKAGHQGRKMILDTIKPKEQQLQAQDVLDDNYSQDDIEIENWLKTYSKSSNDRTVENMSSKWSNNENNLYEMEIEKFPPKQWQTSQNKIKNFQKMIYPAERNNQKYLKELSSSINPPVAHDNTPEPMYLPAGTKPNNILYTSLVDMINVVETLRVKRPSSTLPDDYTDDDLSEDVSNISSGGASSEFASGEGGQIHPQVARVQDRGVPGDWVVSDEGEWVLPRMGPWDPADTPVATAVLGSVMLFLILVVVCLHLFKI